MRLRESRPSTWEAQHLPNVEFEYVYGDIGIVSAISEGSSPTVTVKLDKGNTVSLSPNRWSNYDYFIEEDKNSGKSVIRQREIDTFFQIPLKLAYTITIHKSQGLTLDSVTLRLGSGCFAHGQLYTALSRCRSIGDLSIERPVMPEDLILDQAVVDFYESIDQPQRAVTSVTIAISRSTRPPCGHSLRNCSPGRQLRHQCHNRRPCRHLRSSGKFLTLMKTQHSAPTLCVQSGPPFRSSMRKKSRMTESTAIPTWST